MADFDYIVVGAGNNGLVCALYLARAGFRVAVLEGQEEVGGAAQTAEVTLPGFKHDLYATNLTGFLLSPVYKDLKRDLAKAGVHFLTGDCCYATVCRKGDFARVYRDPRATETEMRRHSEADLAGWKSALRLFSRTSTHLFALHRSEMPSNEMLWNLSKFATSEPFNAARLGVLLLSTPRAFTDAYFQSTAVKALFAPWAFHLDYGPDVHGGAGFAFLSAISAYANGVNICEGGTGVLMKALAEMIRGAGGLVRVRSPVAKILLRGHRAESVMLEDGTELSASKALIANLAPSLIFGQLVAPENVPSKFLARMGRFRHAEGTFVVHMALREPLAWRATSDLQEFGYVHLNGTTPEIAATYDQAQKGLIPERPMLIVSQTSHLDPSRAPNHAQVVRIHARAFPTRIVGDAAGTITDRTWDDIKEPVAERLIDLLAEHVHGLRQSLLKYCAVSPADLELLNPNLVHGDCNGGSHHLNQYYFLRPALGYARYKTPITGLYMIGASQWPGSGINGASGYLLARRLVGGGIDTAPER